MLEFDLDMLLAQVIRDKEHALRGPNVRIVFILQTDSLRVVADENRVGQAISNLVDNAVTFTAEGMIVLTSEPSD